MNHSKFVSAAAIGLLGLAAPFMVAQAATYTAEEKANIKAVADFYAALDARDAAGGESKMPIRPILEKYIKEDYIQHMAGQEQGREGLAKMFEGRAGGPPRGGAAPNGAAGPPPGGAPPGGAPPGGAGGPPGGASKVVFIGAVGNMVVRINQRTMPGFNGQAPSTMTIFNMFRVEGGKLAEHWDGSSGGGMGGGPGGPGGAGGPPRGGAGGPPGAGGPAGQ